VLGLGTDSQPLILLDTALVDNDRIGEHSKHLLHNNFLTNPTPSSLRDPDIGHLRLTKLVLAVQQIGL
jgi:hypothetical protein